MCNCCDIQTKLNKFRKSSNAIKLFNSLNNGDIQIVFGRPILGKILILPRSSIEQFQNLKPWACISIGENRQMDFPFKLSMKNCLQFLRIEFSDSEVDCKFHNYKLPVFNNQHAHDISNAINPIWNVIEVLVVHCHAGISRSAAIGKAFAEYYNQPNTDLYDDLYCPNQLVYNIMKNELVK